jgi:hypothetical protein
MYLSDEQYTLKPDFDDGEIPLLKTVFQRFPYTHINVDLKGVTDELIDEVKQLILGFNRQHITYWG